MHVIVTHVKVIRTAAWNR